MIAKNNQVKGQNVGGLGTFYLNIGREFGSVPISKYARTTTKRVFKTAGLPDSIYIKYRSK